MIALQSLFCEKKPPPALVAPPPSRLSSRPHAAASPASGVAGPREDFTAMRRLSLIAAAFAAALTTACAQLPGLDAQRGGGAPMDAAQARAYLADAFLTCRQADGGGWMRSFPADGSGYLYSGGATIEGAWRVAADGRACLRRNDTGVETCHAVAPTAQGVTLTDDRGAVVDCVAG
ncbi:MAG: hypothetical protein COY86_03445 [Rhodobacterales bacterium CG_4_10_14_0_8_um_filter_70_9]|nr:MAG: hypothetical protein COY86_03445 [Rhodobacterales bacterium CG_4_10_14_0_8_um_filter_70_9]PJA59561.1 MAG: hypothetical protein CO163_08665 [Rhodobacterales bacterium CG_4_9_14_3_um_filter_71_31]